MTIHRWPAFAAVALITVFVACAPPLRKGPEPATGAGGVEQRAWAEIANGAPVVDVRTDAEFREGHLPGAVNIPYDQVASRLGELPADRNQTIILYCRSGRRSGIAQQTLKELGFTKAINAGGYEALMRARPER